MFRWHSWKTVCWAQVAQELRDQTKKPDCQIKTPQWCPYINVLSRNLNKCPRLPRNTERSGRASDWKALYAIHHRPCTEWHCPAENCTWSQRYDQASNPNKIITDVVTYLKMSSFSRYLISASLLGYYPSEGLKANPTFRLIPPTVFFPMIYVSWICHGGHAYIKCGNCFVILKASCLGDDRHVPCGQCQWSKKESNILCYQPDFF